MKNTSRFLAALLIALLLVPTLCISALAGYDGMGFGLFWTTSSNADGSLTVIAGLYDVYTGDDPDPQLYDMYQPVLVITDADQNEISRIRITGPETSAVLTTPGSYTAAVYDYAGNMQGNFVDVDGFAEYQGLPLSITEETWFGGGAYFDLDQMYEYGYRFIAQFTTQGSAVSVTLSALREEDSARLSQLIQETQPAVNVVYAQNGEFVDEQLHRFSSDTILVDINGYDGAEFWVCAPDSEDPDIFSSCAVTASANGDWDEAFYFVGEFPTYEPILFDDVDYADWYGDAVFTATDIGLMNGVSDENFAPFSNMTYAEAITLAARIHALYYDEDIPDTSSGPWYQMYVDYAGANGIPCDYDYSAKATREDYVHIFYAALPQDDYFAINTVRDGAIPDLDAQHPYASEIYTFYRAGILTGGDAQGSFKPQSNITRCEVAAIVCRMVDFSLRKEFTLN